MTTLITGANTGIGLATASELAARGHRLFLACRSREKAENAVAVIRQRTSDADIHLLDLDLTSFASVRSCAESFLALDEPLDLLINNAGVAGVRAVTADGFEPHFGTNHLGHFLLTTLLLERIKSSGPARIVIVASDAQFTVKKGIDWDAQRRPARSLGGFREYAVSKLCNVLFAQELARRLADENVTTYALHPGVVASDIWRKIPWPVRPIIKARMVTNEEGARTSLYCATSPDVAKESGLYYDKSSQRDPSPLATPELGADLWRRSEQWTAEHP